MGTTQHPMCAATAQNKFVPASHEQQQPEKAPTVPGDEKGPSQSKPLAIGGWVGCCPVIREVLIWKKAASNTPCSESQGPGCTIGN